MNDILHNLYPRLDEPPNDTLLGNSLSNTILYTASVSMFDFELEISTYKKYTYIMPDYETIT